MYYQYYFIRSSSLFVLQFWFYYYKLTTSLRTICIICIYILLNLLINHGVFFAILYYKLPVAAHYYGTEAPQVLDNRDKILMDYSSSVTRLDYENTHVLLEQSWPTPGVIITPRGTS